MPVYNTFNYSKLIVRAFHATPTTVVLREMPGIHHSHQRFPAVADVRTGTIYGPGQFEQQGYLIGTMAAGGGSAAYRPIGSFIVRGYGESSMGPVSLGDSIYRHFGTASPTTGAATNADSTPTIVVAEDGVDLVYVPTVTNVATGLYKVQIDATSGNGFEAGKRYSVYVVATVGGVTGRDGLDEFEVLTFDLNTTLNATLSSRLSLNQFIALK
jgi:hypothetical protein